MNKKELFAPISKKNRSSKLTMETKPFFRVSQFSNPYIIFGGILFFLLVLLALIGPILSHFNYQTIQLELNNLKPSSLFWFGTDDLGRDLFVRTCWGMRVSLFIGLMAALIDLAFGTIYGAISGFFGGKVDEIMMRICDFFSSVPHLLIVMILIIFLGAGIKSIILGFAITNWINMARIIRGQILQISQLDYMLSAKAVGASNTRIVIYYLIPNCIGSILATVTLTIPQAIFSESFLSFLGLGIQPPLPSLGTMMSDALGSYYYYPWRLFFPATSLTLIILSLNTLGNGLTDAFDPRVKK